MQEFNEKINKKEFKSPIISIFGHVDAGKTSLMDSIRNTNKVEKEAGRITQSIGSYFVDVNDIEEVSKSIKNKFKIEEHLIPGFIIIDTPGHSAFSALRQQGSTLCNITILVIDIIKGIQPQTEECISILKNNNIPFIIAANKIDMIPDWVNSKEMNFKKAFNIQTDQVKNEFNIKIMDLKYELEQKEIISELYLDNTKQRKVNNIVPISTRTKEGLSDILNLLIYISQTFMSSLIKFEKNIFDATVMDSGLDKAGYYIDIILSNGTINNLNKLIVHTDTGVKSSSIRNIMKETLTRHGERNVIEFINIDSAQASCGLRIYGNELSGAFCGSKIYKTLENDIEGCDIIAQAEMEMKQFWKKFNSKFSTSGVYLIVPTIGEFDAVFTHLIENKIPIIGGEIGLVKKLSVIKFSNSIDKNEYKENKIILYFNSKTQKLEEEELKLQLITNNIELISSDILYDLSDKYNKRKDIIIEERKKENISNGKVVFPCCLMIIDEKHVFRKGGKDNFLFGIKVLNGTLHKGTPIFAKTEKEIVTLGKVTKIISHKGNKETQLDKVEKGIPVSVQIKNENGKNIGRHFQWKDKLFSMLNRHAIEILKKDYRNLLLDKQIFSLIKEIKEIQKIK